MKSEAKLPEPVSPNQSPATLLQLAIERDVDVEKLERMMALYERWQEKEQEREFNKALAEFQAECPPIEKTKAVTNKDKTLTYYKYAPLEKIEEVVKPVLFKNGFVYDFDTEREGDNSLKTIVFLRHENGYARRGHFTIPAIQGTLTNAAQDEGSKNTFGKRRALENILGITTQEDDDGQSAMPENIVFLLKHNEVVRDNLLPILEAKDCFSSGDWEKAAEIIAEMDRPTADVLWRAPRNGGMWTTKEREMMKSKEFNDIVHLRRKEAGWYDRSENQI